MVAVAKVIYGRGGWPASGVGGTLDVRGILPGPYYRAPAAGSNMKMPGAIAARAVRVTGTCDVNEYAVYMAVKALQPYFGAVPDGILGPLTAAAIKTYQSSNGLTVDGIIGPETSRSLFAPLVLTAAHIVDPASPPQRALKTLAMVTTGHIGYESLWDAGAVGYSTPDDLGLGQINGPAHPTISMEAALTPSIAINWVARFVQSNILAMNGNVRDGIAAYNLGIGGARSWVTAGRPAVWTRIYAGKTYTTAVEAYIEKVLAAGA